MSKELTVKKKAKKKRTLKTRAGKREKAGISPQHKIFADHLRASKTWIPSEAYMKAYPNVAKQVAQSSSYKLLQRRDVQEYLEEKRLLMEEKVDLTQEEILKDIMELRDMCMGRKVVSITTADRDGNLNTIEAKSFNAAGAKGALELLGKNKKMFVDKIEHSGRITANFNFDTGKK